MGGGNAPIRPWARAQPNPVRPGVAPVQMRHRPPEPLVPNVTDPQTFRAMRGFLTAANGDGRSRMVKEFTQSSLGLGDEDKGLKGGVCAAISMQWIAKSASS